VVGGVADVPPERVLGVGRKFLGFVALVCLAILAPYIGMESQLFGHVAMAYGVFAGSQAVANGAAAIAGAIKTWGG